MEYAYLGSNAISATVWLTLFSYRKDLRNMMLIASLLALPLALFDLLFVPSYWDPVILFDIPIGIEGFLFAFSVGGVAAVLYAELSKKKLKHIKSWRVRSAHGLLVPSITLAVFAIAYSLGPNPEIATYIAIAAGLILTFYMRPDLASNAFWAALAFGVVYFTALKIWVTLFPGVENWFVFEGMPYFFFWGVPGWEALFGFFFGAYWGCLYELLFGYKLVQDQKQKFKDPKTP